MFDIRLRVFHTVAKCLNFTKAVQDLFVTQLAVTKHIQEIESHFKVKLFERHGTKIKLTPAGEKLLQFTGRILSLYSNLEFEMNVFMQRDVQLRIIKKLPVLILSYKFEKMSFF